MIPPRDRESAYASFFTVEQWRRCSPSVREDELLERTARTRRNFAPAKFLRQRFRIARITDSHAGNWLELCGNAVSLAHFFHFDPGHLMNAQAVRSRLHHQIRSRLAQVVDGDAIRLTILRKCFSRGREDEHRRMLSPGPIYRHETRRSLLEILRLSFARENEIPRLFVHRRGRPARRF